jgi:hypothetical protein
LTWSPWNDERRSTPARSASPPASNRYRLVSALFLRLLALIYLAAFISLGLQISGLAGPEGILPLEQHLDSVQQRFGWQGYTLLPTLFWLNPSDLALQGVAIAGCAFALLLLFNRLVRSSLVLLFLLYLSLVQAGQTFTNFQWDYLLLEAGFLAILLPTGSPLAVWLFRWLLFRLRFLSGAAKLVSGDPSWAGFTALQYYFETQPLPHTGAWYAHQLPDWVLRAGVGWVFFVELAVPLMMLLPRRFRLFAAIVTIATQSAILATSNHNFFNLLTIVLCLFLIDDQALRRLLPPGVARRLLAASPQAEAVRPWRSRLAAGLAALILVVSGLQMWELLARERLPRPLSIAVQQISAWRIVNKYHVFPTITTQRLELRIEGSRDGEHWRPYRFRYRVDDPAQMPPFLVPHQPRLDWMLWFVPAGHPLNLDWFERFAQRLLDGSPAVIGLLAENPFPGDPPRFLRIGMERYRFNDPAQRAETGNWWQRERLGPFFPLPLVQRPEPP